LNERTTAISDAPRGGATEKVLAHVATISKPG